ncbi:molybdenum cofactor synthesis domain protein (plasmid) [Haloterrigena turkmenica DSM 5511]|uniref:Molybdenum cofactor synthesis domain protein n=1 Tax=Haloterrigena turkmenica (strain ATCC 51198 / DSM 5511 / JCM 9101 / NCIMB 13204 / VKM B-1734 / 4k) TaxID=543526 RepID=D2S083_HALTV|nr:molybdopterin molybdotransferase MoeA [Haloterrigena turkmenica]ADB62780.1 molybdenum cofactor synthesis domain protein [Haloterrigena turkmenica DSM 5511]
MGHDHESMLSRSEAVGEVLDVLDRVLSNRGTRELSVGDGVAGRFLAESITAPRDVPAHDHATMDGFAIDATESYPLTVSDAEIFPEDEPPSLADGEAVHIATGAPLPERANAVLKIEEATVESDELRGSDLEPGTYTYERGSNVSAGETLFRAGERISAKDLVLLRDLGIERVSVYEPFSAGLLATGSEIHEGTTADLDSPMLAALVRSWGHSATIEGTVPDEYERTRDRIERVAREHDVVITTGGTSVGEKDYVIRALEALGTVRFHRVRIRPGKPIAVARLPDHDAVAFAIPGKPVGAHTVATLVMRSFFVGDTGPVPTIDATITSDVGIGTAGFEYAVPVTVDDGNAVPLGHVDSPLEVYEETFDPSVLSSSTRATRADGIVITESDLSAGESVRVIPYPVLE